MVALDEEGVMSGERHSVHGCHVPPLIRMCACLPASPAPSCCPQTASVAVTPTAGAASEPKVSRAAGTFDTASEAAVARDLALMWRQLGLGQPLESVDGHERFNLPPARSVPGLSAHIQTIAVR